MTCGWFLSPADACFHHRPHPPHAAACVKTATASPPAEAARAPSGVCVSPWHISSQFQSLDRVILSLKHSFFQNQAFSLKQVLVQLLNAPVHAFFHRAMPLGALL